jgi:general bacterial porin, GBP family
MKKHLIAAAVAAAVAAPAAFAQNVSLYGTVDLSYGSYSAVGSKAAGAGTQSAVQSGMLTTNRLGFRGEEDLGSGLKAGFVLETAMPFDSEGTRSFGDRGAELYLSGGFGQIRIGKAATSDANTLCSGPTNLTNFTTCGTATRPDNRVQYITPAMNGFTANIAYATDAADDEDLVKVSKNNGRYTNIGLNYNSGPLRAVLFQARTDVESAAVAGQAGACINNSTGVITALTSGSCGAGTRVLTSRISAANEQDGKVKDTGLLVSYNFGIATAQLRHVRTKTSGDVNTEIDTKTTAIDVTAPLGNGVTAGLGYVNMNRDGNDTDGKRYAFYVSKELSKRTNVYAAYARNDQDKAAPAHTTTGGLAAGSGRDQTIYGLGIRHSF